MYACTEVVKCIDDRSERPIVEFYHHSDLMDYRVW